MVLHTITDWPETNKRIVQLPRDTRPTNKCHSNRDLRWCLQHRPSKLHQRLSNRKQIDHILPDSWPKWIQLKRTTINGVYSTPPRRKQFTHTWLLWLYHILIGWIWHFTPFGVCAARCSIHCQSCWCQHRLDGIMWQLLTSCRRDWCMLTWTAVCKVTEISCFRPWCPQHCHIHDQPARTQSYPSWCNLLEKLRWGMMICKI